MHYVISYDLENNRLRDQCAKLLEKNGCQRVQKSVFVAPGLNKRDLSKLHLGLRQLLAQYPSSADDSVCVIPLGNDYVSDIKTFGANDVGAILKEKKWKEIL